MVNFVNMFHLNKSSDVLLHNLLFPRTIVGIVTQHREGVASVDVTLVANDQEAASVRTENPPVSLDKVK